MRLLVCRQMKPFLDLSGGRHNHRLFVPGRSKPFRPNARGPPRGWQVRLSMLMELQFGAANGAPAGWQVSFMRHSSFVIVLSLFRASWTNRCRISGRRGTCGPQAHFLQTLVATARLTIPGKPRPQRVARLHPAVVRAGGERGGESAMADMLGAECIGMGRKKDCALIVAWTRRCCPTKEALMCYNMRTRPLAGTCRGEARFEEKIVLFVTTHQHIFESLSRRTMFRMDAEQARSWIQPRHKKSGSGFRLRAGWCDRLMLVTRPPEGFPLRIRRLTPGKYRDCTNAAAIAAQEDRKRPIRQGENRILGDGFAGKHFHRERCWSR